MRTDCLTPLKHHIALHAISNHRLRKFTHSLHSESRHEKKTAGEVSITDCSQHWLVLKS